ncbi:hypothetical protein [Leifsonia poae]|uniref:hypothetical protein n=1 Tax=Leifsonia poae TaxID=110933 RepID=UPI001CC04B4F|nr:hypothetical protein [Leifsonia poae]
MVVTTATVSTGFPSTTGARKPPGRASGFTRGMRRLPVRILLTVLVIVELYPIFWLVMGSFKTQNEFFSQPTWALPSTSTSPTTCRPGRPAASRTTCSTACS